MEAIQKNSSSNYTYVKLASRIAFITLLCCCTYAAYAQEIKVEANDFQYDYNDQVPSSGGGQKFSGIFFSTQLRLKSALPKNLNLYVPIQPNFAEEICFELLSSGGNHEASWTIKVPDNISSGSRLTIDLEKELGKQFSGKERRNTINRILNHTVQGLTVKAWARQRDCRIDSISNSELVFLPVSWDKLRVRKPAQLSMLMLAEGAPTIYAHWKDGSMDAKKNCVQAELENGRTAKYDYLCSIDLMQIGSNTELKIIINDKGVPYYSSVQLAY